MAKGTEKCLTEDAKAYKGHLKFSSWSFSSSLYFYVHFYWQRQPNCHKSIVTELKRTSL